MVEQKQKRGRGRPRKNPLPADSAGTETPVPAPAPEVDPDQPVAKRGRGRPRKNPLPVENPPEAASSPTIATEPPPVPAPTTAPVPATPVTVHADKQVNAAVEEINRIAKASVVAGLLEIGNYIIKTFYDDNIEKVADRDPAKSVSVRKIAHHPDLELSPTYIFNSLRLAVDHRLLGDKNEYLQLSASHQLALARLSGTDSKLDLAQQAVLEHWPVTKLQEKVRELLGAEEAARLSDGKMRPGRKPDPMSYRAVRRAYSALEELSGLDDLAAGLGSLKPEALDDLKAQLKVAMERLVAIEKAISGLAD